MTTTTGIPFSPNGDTKTAINFDDVFDMPDDVQDKAAETSRITAQRIAAAIDALAPVIEDLDYQHKVTMLESFRDLIADIPADERGPIEAPVLKVVKTGQAADEFWSKIPVAVVGAKFKPYTLHDLLLRPQKVWLIENVIGAGDLVMLYGASGSGKTHIAIDLMFAAITGRLFARRFAVARRLNIAYAAGEGISGLAQRFAAVSDFYMSHDPLGDFSNFTFFDVVPQLYAGSDALYAERITDFVTEWKDRQAKGEAQPLDILVIDTLHTATAGADENSAKDMGIVLNLAKRVTKELGCAVILVHHTGKSGESERGSSALRGAMDTMIHISKLSDNGTKAVMRCAKSKDSEAWKDQTFDLVDHLDSVRVWWDEPADSEKPNSKQKGDIDAIVSLLSSSKPGARYTAKSIAEGIGVSPSSTQVFKLIKLAMAQDSAIKSGLKFPDKDAHSTNPTMYWYSSLDSLTH